jgi:hypothetical protein
VACEAHSSRRLEVCTGCVSEPCVPGCTHGARTCLVGSQPASVCHPVSLCCVSGALPVLYWSSHALIVVGRRCPDCTACSWHVCTIQECSQQAAGYSATGRIHIADSLKHEPQTKPGPHRTEHGACYSLAPCRFQCVCADAVRGPTTLNSHLKSHLLIAHLAHAPLAAHSTHTAADQSWRKDQRTRTRPRPGECCVGSTDTPEA